jgi:type II secretory pathway pseudopilin PulG
LSDARGERGFSLIEAVVATAIATIAVMGMAHSFGTGRALINRFEVARKALGAAQRRVEFLSSKMPTEPELNLASYGPFPLQLDGRTYATESWVISRVDDPADGMSPSDVDLKLITVRVVWGAQRASETIQLTSLVSTR